MSDTPITPWDLQNAIAQGVTQALSSLPHRPMPLDERRTLLAHVAGTIATGLVMDRIHYVIGDPSVPSRQDVRREVAEAALSIAEHIIIGAGL